MIGGMPESATRSLELLATRYAFVGLTEHYGIGFAVLQSLLGFKGAADVRKLARLPDGNRPSLENVKAFELLNREDLLLYDSLSEYHVLSTMEPTGEIGLRLRRVGEIAPLAGYRANRA